MQMPWNLTHNPFVKQPPREERTRQLVFTGRDVELSHLLSTAEQGEPCCLYGTYGMGKSMLMLEACRIIKSRQKGIIPVYACVDPGQGYKDFDQIVLREISKALEDRGIKATEKSDEPTFETIRGWTQAGQAKDLRVFAMIDDMDRPQDIEKIPTVIHSVRALRGLGCGVCLPANPNHATHKFATAGQGIFDRIDLAPLELGEYVQMVSRYLDTARGRTADILGPKIFLSYARPDLPEVDRLYGALKNLGACPWMDKRDLMGGENWPIAIEAQIKASDFVVFCLSPRSYKRRGFVMAEMRFALKTLEKLLSSDIYLIPVRLEECEVPPELADINCIDLFEEGGMAALEKSIKEGIRRRGDGGRDEMITSKTLNTEPFEEGAIVKIVNRIGGVEHITPRMLNTACRSLLGFAVDSRVGRISEEFVDSKWERIGAQVLANEGDIERCARLVQQLVEHEGFVDEDSLDLETVLGLLNKSHGGFADLLEVFGSFDDVFHVEDRGGNMTVLLSPLIDQDFVRNVFLKKKTEEFRQEFGRRGDDNFEEHHLRALGDRVIDPRGPIV